MHGQLAHISKTGEFSLHCEEVKYSMNGLLGFILIKPL